MEALAACHVHSEWSYDGSWSLEALSARFSRRGYRILMMTEHDREFSASRYAEYRTACAQASSEKIFVLPGIEYSDMANRVHVLVWGPVPFLGDNRPTSEILNEVRANKGVAVLAHPSRKNAWTCFEPYWADTLLGIEVWNRKYDGWAPSRTAPGLLQRARAIPFVGLDFHTERQSYPLAMALDVDTSDKGMTEENVLQSLRSHRCRACAFGVTFSQKLFQTVLPALSILEQSRRTAASILRTARVLTH